MKRKFNVDQKIRVIEDLNVTSQHIKTGKVIFDVIPKGTIGKISKHHIGSISLDYVYTVLADEKFFYTSDAHIELHHKNI